MKKLNRIFLILIVVASSDIHSQSLQWRTLPNSPYVSPGNRFPDIYFINPSTGWVLQISGKVFKTTNGGNSWDTVFNSSGNIFRSLGFFDSQTGLIGTLYPDSNKVLYRTTNGGANFTAITNLPAPRIQGTCGINIVNENVAYACGKWDGPARIVKTTDKGYSWTSCIIDTSLAQSLVDCYFWSADSGVAVGGSYPFVNQNAVIIKTEDGGNSWHVVHRTLRSGELCWKVMFVNRNLGYTSIQGSGLYYLKTTDGGNTWEEKQFMGAYFQQGIGFVNETTGWIGGWTGSNYVTTDAGISWHPAGWGLYLNRIRFLNDTLAYAVGNRVYKYSKETVGVYSVSLEIAGAYLLSQNYPNPFNPVTKIKFDIPRDARGEKQDVKLVIFDVLGKEVMTLVNEALAPGSYEADFEGSNFASGMYFYKLEAGSFVETKRMMLLK